MQKKCSLYRTFSPHIAVNRKENIECKIKDANLSEVFPLAAEKAITKRSMLVSITMIIHHRKNFLKKLYLSSRSFDVSLIRTKSNLKGA